MKLWGLNGYLREKKVILYKLTSDGSCVRDPCTGVYGPHGFGPLMGENLD
jgi:hypothetical protein